MARIRGLSPAFKDPVNSELLVRICRSKENKMKGDLYFSWDIVQGEYAYPFQPEINWAYSVQFAPLCCKSRIAHEVPPTYLNSRSKPEFFFAVFGYCLNPRNRSGAPMGQQRQG